MKQLFLICIITFQLMILVTESRAQNFSLTGSLGASNYRGDLATHYTPPFGADFSLGATYDLSSQWRLRANFSSLKIEGDDALSSSAGIRYRNLNFKSNVSEFALLGEYDILSDETNSIIPYIFGGVGVYHFDPHPLHPISGTIKLPSGNTVSLNGDDVDLHSLGTEGQYISKLTATINTSTGPQTLTTRDYSDRAYNLTQLNLQLGLGVRFVISDAVSLGFEANIRQLFTDYLDDASAATYVTPTDWKIAEAYYQSQGTAGVANLKKTLEAEAYSYRGVLGSKFADVNALSYPRGNPNNNDSYYTFQIRLNVRLNAFGGEDGSFYTNNHPNGRKQLRCAGNVY